MTLNELATAAVDSYRDRDFSDTDLRRMFVAGYLAHVQGARVRLPTIRAPWLVTILSAVKLLL